jgi:hypothetical protein
VKTHVIERDELVRIVTEASATGCAERTRRKLIAVAETTDAVAFGWFHCDGVGCPARQARVHNQTFQKAYDEAMSRLLGAHDIAVARVGVLVEPRRKEAS